MKKIVYTFILVLWMGIIYSQSCEAIFTYDAGDITVEFTDLSTTQNNDPIVSWSWDFDGLGTSNQQNPVFTFPQDDKYDIILTITTQSGCTSSIEIRIEICKINVNYQLGACDVNGNIPVDITVTDTYNNIENINITVDGQLIPGNPYLLDNEIPVITSFDIAGDGLDHILSVFPLGVAGCGEEILILAEDCNSDCFLSGLTISYAEGTTHQVNIGDNFFSPSSIAIALGDVVRFNWVGDGHSTTSDASSGEDSWNSGVLSIGSTYDVNIKNPGTHPYYCIPHGAPGGVGMSGEILSNCPGGNTLDLVVNFNTQTANPQGYQISIDGTPISGSPFNYQGAGIQSQNIQIPGDNQLHTIEIVDVAVPACTISTTYQSPDCNQGGGEPVCNISATIENLQPCNINEEISGELLVTHNNGGNGFSVLIDGFPFQSFSYSGNPTVVNILLPGDGMNHNISVTDDIDPACTASVAITTTDCTIPCSITNLAASPPTADGTPSGIIHQVEVRDFEFVPSSISISEGDQVQWVWTGSIDHTSTSDASTGTNAWDSGLLGNGGTFTSPVLSQGTHPYYCIPHGAPGGVGMSGVVNVLPPCDQNNNVSVNISFDIQGPGAQGYQVIVDGITTTNFSYVSGTGQSASVLVPGDGMTHNIEVVDIESGTCNATTTVTTPMCELPPEPCQISVTASESGSCINDLIAVDISVTASNQGNNFTLSIDGNQAGTFLYDNGATTTITVDIPGDGMNHNISVTDDIDLACTASVAITTTDCTIPCSITNLAASPPTADGTPSGIIHQVEVRDFEFVPSSISISEGDQVQWVWTGSIDHTSTSDANNGTDAWDSGLLGKGGTFTSPVLSQGTHPYYCIPHGAPGGVGMSGVVNVLPPCDQNNNVSVNISFDIQGPGAQGYQVMVDGLTTTNFSYVSGAGQSASVLVPGDGMTHNIEIIDTESGACNATTTVTTSMCEDIQSCQVAMRMSGVSSCSDGVVSIQLSLDSDLSNSTVEIWRDDILMTTVETNENGEIDFSLDVIGNGENNIWIARVPDMPECIDTLMINTPLCDHSCIINDLEVSNEPGVHYVEVKDFEFSPKDIEIVLGDTVRFSWTGEIPHTVTSDVTTGEDAFDSGLWSQGHNFDLVIQNPGTHPYYCIPHGGPGGIGMAGVIQVRDSCNTETLITKLHFSIDGGSNFGFHVFLDGEQYTEVPILYQNKNGQNNIPISLPADGIEHQVTIQDLESETCAFTTFITNPLCDTTCIFSNLDIKTGSQITHTIKVRDFEFFPADVTVKIGETVRFIWVGDIPHTTTSDALSGIDSWDSGLLSKHDTFDLVIQEVGLHPYYCIPHGGPGGIGMAGTINALPACVEGNADVRFAYEVTNGSSEGFNIFVDGILNDGSPFQYKDQNGFNDFVINIPGDGALHTLTIQDVTTDFCAFSSNFNALQCSEGCDISGLSYESGLAGKDTVYVQDFEFVPREIEAESGDTIVFIWTGDIPHTVTSDATKGNSVFNSGLLEKGGEFIVVLQESGNHPYYCIPHGGPGGIGMAGNILIREGCEDNLLDYSFSFFRSTASVGYSVLVNDEVVGENIYTPGEHQHFSLSLPADGQDRVISVRDNSDNSCSNEVSIPAIDCNDPCTFIQPNFDIEVDYEGLSVSLSDNSSGVITSYQWDMGDGTLLMGESIDYTYEVSGTYEICLTVEDGTGCNATFCNKVNFDQEVCDISYEYIQDGLDFTFINTSSISTTDYNISWNFEDGTSIQHVDTAVHTFSPGVYEVCLSITSESCNDVFCITLDLTDPCLPFTTDFDYTVNPDDDLELSFTHLSSNSANQWLWGLGDGNTSDLSDITHTYDAPGTYTVCLLAQDIANNCNSAFCQTITVGTSAVEENTNQIQQLIAFPNPAKVQNPVYMTGFKNSDINKTAQVTINSLSGVLITMKKIKLQEVQPLDLSENISPGVYLIHISTALHSYLSKIVIN